MRVVPAEAGIRFGQYVLLRRLARGGMAEVFLAQQRGLEGFDRRVAVKRILPHLVDSPDFVKMFLGEAKLVAKLSHPNIVHIYDFGKVEQDYFIAMEYVDGVHAGQLFQHFAKERLSPTFVARLGADAAAALHYAHELRGPNGKPLGLVHRDVSPANIMVSYDGVVKLCDFGIAKAAALSDQLTNPGQVKGKYAYMSPEQTIAAPLDGRSDVFSLAIVLWELLAGKTIVPRGDAVDAMRAIRDGRLQPIEKAAPGTPPELAKAISWALANKRDKRATAEELALALEAFVKASPEIATPMQLGAWIRKRFPRDATGQHAALDARAGGPGTSAAGTIGGTVAGGGTLAADGTVAGGGTLAAGGGTLAGGGTVAGTASRVLPVTPPGELIAASRIGGPDETNVTVALTGEELAAVREHTVVEPPPFTPPRAARARAMIADTDATALDDRATDQVRPERPSVIVDPGSRGERRPARARSARRTRRRPASAAGRAACRPRPRRGRAGGAGWSR